MSERPGIADLARPRQRRAPPSDTGFRPRYWRFSGFGLFIGAFFFAASLTPSLMPRPPVMQGALSGVSLSIGYVIGALLLWVWRVMELRELEGKAEGRARRIMILAALLICGGALSQALEWRNATRAVMGLEPVNETSLVIVTSVAIVVFLLLWLLGAAFSFVLRRSAQVLGALLPGRTGAVAGLAVTVWLFWAIGNGVLVREVLEAADASFATGEQLFNPAQEQPTDPAMTGSPGSLVTWEDLGNRGRDFVARTPPADEIATFAGEDAQRPVRVYVGRVSAEDARARAELALEELIRQGGFDREILIVTTPVGTGWMDPGSHDVVDFMWGGDVAHVAAQYSYLTSVLSILTNVEYGLDQSRALFDVIYGHWKDLPEDSRPRFYIHGLSQGAMNSQATLPFFQMLSDPIGGAFWAGSPFLSPIWQQVIAAREPGSPSWRPVVADGSFVRVSNQENTFSDPSFAPWGPLRFVFLSYASDPIVNFDTATLWRAPSWLREAERAPDVSPEMRWYPIVTAFQLVLDMTTALGVEGFGHYYVYADYIDAWAALTDPPGWSTERADRLRAIFDERPAPW